MARTKPLSRERGAICSPTSSTNHSKLPSTVTTPPSRVPPFLSLSLFFPHQPLGSPPPVPAASNPTPRSALSNVRPPFPYAFLRAQPFQSSQIISAITKPRGKGRGGSKPVPGLALENPSETNRACSLETVLLLFFFLFFYTRMCRRNAFVSCARLGESWKGRGRRVECVK